MKRVVFTVFVDFEDDTVALQDSNFIEELRSDIERGIDMEGWCADTNFVEIQDIEEEEDDEPMTKEDFEMFMEEAGPDNDVEGNLTTRIIGDKMEKLYAVDKRDKEKIKYLVTRWGLKSVELYNENIQCWKTEKVFIFNRHYVVTKD